jgi:vacuolar protein sorting-associated protein 41
MASQNGELEDEPSRFVTDSPDQLSLAEERGDKEDAGGGAIENGHADGGEDYSSSSSEEESENEEGEEEEAEEDDGETQTEEDAKAEHGLKNHETHEDRESYEAGRSDESEEEGYEDEDEDEDDDDDEEPALKYERLGGSVHDLFQKDSASSLASSHQRLVRLYIS